MESFEEESRPRRTNHRSDDRDPVMRSQGGSGGVGRERANPVGDTSSTIAPSSGVREPSESPPPREEEDDIKEAPSGGRAVCLLTVHFFLVLLLGLDLTSLFAESVLESLQLLPCPSMRWQHAIECFPGHFECPRHRRSM